MITWITENVAIGEYADAVNAGALMIENIKCILSLRGGDTESDDSFENLRCKQCGIDYYRVPIMEYDKVEVTKIQLRTAAYMLEQLTEKYKRILVHCTAGIDRAPFVVAYWIGKYSGGKDVENMIKDYDLRFWITRAYEFIKGKRPQVIEHMEWV